MARTIKFKKDHTGYADSFAGVKLRNDLPHPTTEYRPSNERFSYFVGTIVKVEVMDETVTHAFIDLDSGIRFTVPDRSYYDYVE